MKATLSQPSNLGTIRREAPGQFAEAISEIVSKGLSFKDFWITVEDLELGDNPFEEELELTFRVKGPGVDLGAAGVGPQMFFTFNSSDSIDLNLTRFQHFVETESKRASSCPHAALMEHNASANG